MVVSVRQFPGLTLNGSILRTPRVAAPPIRIGPLRISAVQSTGSIFTSAILDEFNYCKIYAQEAMKI